MDIYEGSRARMIARIFHIFLQAIICLRRAYNYERNTIDGQIDKFCPRRDLPATFVKCMPLFPHCQSLGSAILLRMSVPRINWEDGHLHQPIVNITKHVKLTGTL